MSLKSDCTERRSVARPCSRNGPPSHVPRSDCTSIFRVFARSGVVGVTPQLGQVGSLPLTSRRPLNELRGIAIFAAGTNLLSVFAKLRRWSVSVIVHVKHSSSSEDRNSVL